LCFHVVISTSFAYLDFVYKTCALKDSFESDGCNFERLKVTAE